MSPKGPNGLETDLRAQRCEEGQALGRICLGEKRGWVSGDAETMMLLSALFLPAAEREVLKAEPGLAAQALYLGKYFSTACFEKHQMVAGLCQSVLLPDERTERGHEGVEDALQRSPGTLRNF